MTFGRSCTTPPASAGMSVFVQNRAAPTRALSMMPPSAITALTGVTAVSWSDRRFMALSFSSLPQRFERGAQLRGEEFRLFPGGEMTAFVDLVVVGEVRIGPPGPALRRLK